MKAWVLFAVVSLGLGCSASEKLSPPSADAAADTGASHDAARDSASEKLSPPSADAAADTGTSHDAARDSGDSGDGGNVCPHVLGPADCPASNTECRPTWAEVLAHPLCPTTSPSINTSHEERFDCDGYHVSIVGHVDTSESYYYDATSGNLVAIYQSSLLKEVCAAGPPGGIALDCPNTTPVRICSPDGG
jgi:hypothetical protein